MKVITNRASRTRVNTSAPGEGCLRLQAMGHVLFYLRLQGVIVGTCDPHQTLDLPEGAVDGESLDGRRPNISLRNMNVRHGDVHVLDAKRLMYAARPGITDHHGNTFRDLPLNVQIPFHHVIARRVLLDIVDAQRLGIGCAEFAEGPWEVPLTQAADRAQQVERSRKKRQVLRLIRKRKYIKHTETTPQRGLSCLEWIPGKSESRLEIAQRGV